MFKAFGKICKVPFRYGIMIQIIFRATDAIFFLWTDRGNSSHRSQQVDFLGLFSWSKRQVFPFWEREGRPLVAPQCVSSPIHCSPYQHPEKRCKCDHSVGLLTTGDREIREAGQNELESWLQGPKLVFITKVKWRVEILIPVIWGERCLLSQRELGWLEVSFYLLMLSKLRHWPLPSLLMMKQTWSGLPLGFENQYLKVILW